MTVDAESPAWRGATAHHLEIATARRDRLLASINGALAQQCEELRRTALSPYEQVEVWRWAKSLGVPGASQQVCTAMGVALSRVVAWARDGAPEYLSIAFEGPFPVMYARLPADGVPCVYALLDPDGIVYVGKSQRIGKRLREHQQGPRREHFDRWSITVCESAAAMDTLEMDLVLQHQPRLNTVGRKTRMPASQGRS